MLKASGVASSYILLCEVAGSSSLREYFSREIKFHAEELNCNSVAELPNYKGFKVTCDFMRCIVLILSYFS